MEQMKRVLSALAILPPLILFLAYASGEFFLVFILGIISLCLYEYFSLLARGQTTPCSWITYLSSWALAVTAYWESWSWLPFLLFCSMIILSSGIMFILKEETSFLPVFVYSLFGVLWIGWNLSHLVILRGFPSGQWYILFLCLIVWGGDSLAMYTGKIWGRHKMAPALSPGKTWEGALGGLIGNLLTAVVSAPILLPHLSFTQTLLLATGIAPIAQVSDLCESMLKRYAGVKDSGTLIPGHGGMLDRIDSLLFAAPMFVYMLVLLGQAALF